ncbi:patatin-like phospholipase family protein [Pseudomonas sp. 10B1]|uniref:patatin-like phospholipase family protein n=1 Tax=unclassified Pseudomonas TaxID=196821 RepID=UPI002AB35546|nr:MULTISPECIES: patatin-like phospholipase family protein [unclassified Pseudomonas]MDY7561164.1 patatin-like phospholipase family protein [Pseudomonas sp. AB6]MEA9978546.1 patatin-like phospholipase family protein [Pseudomonas sp. RTS4]MEA9994263.1 patatin-like phospholipase family protein [Pseudomonas sp. AA4]MEB0088560.1 patatin-like phospholipase family protein [Pseudomonas sp. RTI1]MEB0126517.1 patatin-like phospholipase family protein [Pseudomonas sp. CCC1.2]
MPIRAAEHTSPNPAELAGGVAINSASEPITGLILSGGGARAAYQVGVLAGISELMPAGTPNPFPVIVGTSAGAINAVKLASGAAHFCSAVHQLVDFWQGFRSHQVLRSDWAGVIRQATRFVGHSLLGVGSQVPVALLNSSPLRELLNARLDLEGIDRAIVAKHLRAVAVTAFGYESGQAVTFYQGKGTIDSWLRHRRIGLPTQLTVDHLLASSAIPLLFAPVKIDQEFFGDGAVRQSAPISPALHLGANRVLVVGVSGNPRGIETNSSIQRVKVGTQPTLAQIGGHMLNSTFIDSLESDIELLERLNMLSHLLPGGQPIRTLGLAPVEVLVISPSQPIDEIAARHRHELPPALRTFLRGPGATKTSGAGVLSYLLFEAGYCSELIELGRRDALAQSDQLKQFLRLG